MPRSAMLPRLRVGSGRSSWISFGEHSRRAGTGRSPIHSRMPRRRRPHRHAREPAPTEGPPMPNDSELLLSDDAVDLLIDLVGRSAYERMDPTDPRHGPFFDWLA